MQKIKFDFFKQLVSELGVSSLARKLNCNKAIVSQIAKEKYVGNTNKYINKCWQLLGEDSTVDCPLMGNISGNDCREKKAWVLGMDRVPTGNNLSILLYQTCKTCKKGV